MAKHIVYMKQNKITRNTIRFVEILDDEDSPNVLPMVYIPKTSLAILGNPRTIKVTVETGN